MHALFTCFGPGTTTLRLPSVLAMAVAAACVTAIGTRLADRWAGLAAGLALGLLPAVQSYLQEGRPYALVTAGAGLSTLLLVTQLTDRPRTTRWVLYGTTLLLCALLNWLSLLTLPAHALTLALSRADRATWLRWSTASAAAAAATAPLILFSRHQSTQISWIPPLTWHMLIGPAVLVAVGGLAALADRFGRERGGAGRAGTEVPRVVRPLTEQPTGELPGADQPHMGRPHPEQAGEGLPGGSPLHVTHLRTGQPSEGPPDADQPQAGRPRAEQPGAGHAEEARTGRPGARLPADGRPGADRPRVVRPRTEQTAEGMPANQPQAGGFRTKQAEAGRVEKPSAGQPGGGPLGVEQPHVGRPGAEQPGVAGDELPAADRSHAEHLRAGQRGHRPLSLAAVGLPLLAVPQVGLVFLSLVKPLFLDRYVLFSQLGLAVLVGAGLGVGVRVVRPRFPGAAPFVVPVVLAVAVAALLPYSLAKRAPASRVDDVFAVAGRVERWKRDGNAVLFVPAARRDTALVSPGAFAGLRDIALAQGPVESGTLKGVEAAPGRIRDAMLRERRILLVSDAPEVARPVAGGRDRAKRDVLERYFTPVADEWVRGRRVTVYERSA
ncbi:glycosyltransferase family 39 protein [Streptomyces sp. LaPpAH-108]|uniref:glycosyltransferase family 39 protein n=1 Tax=Streptomyces sp. LaPpAH-108 TaxID=1155714 RepID=UPI0003A960C2|nr:glycosyltransferase family 39 protein [Streptomyces sp. LaPpAH-108]